MFKTIFSTACSLAVIVSLTACGGGGVGSSPPQVPGGPLSPPDIVIETPKTPTAVQPIAPTPPIPAATPLYFDTPPSVGK